MAKESINIDVRDIFLEDDEERMGNITQMPHNKLWEIHRKNGKVTWGDVYSHILAKPERYYAQEEVDPELWGIFNTNPDTEMMCIVEDDDEEYWIPKFDTGMAKAKEEEEMIRKANDWRVTTTIIFAIIAFIGLVIWLVI